MGIRLSPPIEKTYPLEETDKRWGSEGTYVTIRQATQGQHEKRQDLFAEFVSRVSDDPRTFEMVQRWSVPEQHRIEVYLTMIDCNIEDEDGKPLFRIEKEKGGKTWLRMTEEEFAIAWNKLPVDIAEEIHRKVLDCNPTWSALGERS